MEPARPHRGIVDDGSRRGKVAVDHSERGSGTVLSVSLIGAIAAVAVVIAALAAGFDAKHRADSAADFGALAAASALHDPFSIRTPCEAAALVIEDAELVSCTVTATRVVIETRVEVTVGLMRGWHMSGEAEAGPV